MKRAIELVDKEWADVCHESIYPLMEHVAQRAREELIREADRAANDAAAMGFHDQSASDCADRIVAAIRALPVKP
jgi:hypothetical protein